MHLREHLMRLQSVLTEVTPLSVQSSFFSDLFLSGRFAGLETRFGVRKAAGYHAEIFFKIRVNCPQNLPLWLQDYCPLRFHEGSAFSSTDLRIEGGQWLTERVRYAKGNEAFFEVQTEESIRERLTKLYQLACGIETGEFSLKNSTDALQRKNIIRFSLLLSGAILVVVLSAIVISAPILSSQILAMGAKAQGPRKTKVTYPPAYQARVRAAYAVRERRIVPSNSNIFLNVIPDRTTVPMGEKVVLTYSIFTRYETKCWGFYNEGKFQGFRAERPDSSDAMREMVEYKGKKFVKFGIGSVTLSPTGMGEKIIYPGSVFISARDPKGEILDMYLNTKPMVLTVIGKIQKES